MTVKVLRPKLVKMINILKRNVLNPIVMADKILLKTIKVTVGDYLMYIPEVVKLFFKPLLPPLAKPY